MLPTFWLYVSMGRAFAAAAGTPPFTEEQLDELGTEEEYDVLGRAWCMNHQGMLYKLAQATAKAENLSRKQLSYGLEYIRRVAPEILAPVQEDPVGVWLLRHIATQGEGNAEQFRTLMLGSLRRLHTCE